MLNVEVLDDEGLVLCVTHIGTENKGWKKSRCRIQECRGGLMKENLVGPYLGVTKASQVGQGLEAPGFQLSVGNN